MKKRIIPLVLLLLILNSTAAFAQSGDDPFYAVGDLVLARPLGMVSIVVGGAAFIVSLPFALTSGSVGNTADLLVGEPFRFTFKRPLGEFRQVSHNRPCSKDRKDKTDNGEVED